jgi:hypothetical protein
MDSSAPGGASPKERRSEDSLNSLRFHGLLHHGLCTEEFEPRFLACDYYGFYHRPCVNERWHGLSEITAVLIDNSGRIIFNLRCKDCGARDALKTHPFLYKSKDERERVGDVLKLFHLSPKLKARCRAHWWDDE